MFPSIFLNDSSNDNDNNNNNNNDNNNNNNSSGFSSIDIDFLIGLIQSYYSNYQSFNTDIK